MATNEQLLTMLADINGRLARVEKKIYPSFPPKYDRLWNGLSQPSCPLRDGPDAKLTPVSTPFMESIAGQITPELEKK